YRSDGSERVYSAEKIVASSIAELEFSKSYPEHFIFAGPLLYTPPQPSSGGPEFTPGRRHILITLGSHQAHHKDSLADTMRFIARNHPEWVFHFTDGDIASNRSSHDENFHRHSFIHYDALLPRYDLVIHHGGMGVLLHCLSHGIPAIVLPMDFDQFDYAARLADKGLAYRVKSPEQIGAALPLAMNDSSMIQRCREYAAIIATYQPGPMLTKMISETFPER
ncbi:MAG: glycosyl transferase, partial [Akkermansiaceae bacterium]|nr:glycosyl transferase [Akkermansiaceae bacterium]